MKNPFRYFKTSPEVIRLAVMMYIRLPLSENRVMPFSSPFLRKKPERWCFGSSAFPSFTPKHFKTFESAVEAVR